MSDSQRAALVSFDRGRNRVILRHRGVTLQVHGRSVADATAHTRCFSVHVADGEDRREALRVVRELAGFEQRHAARFTVESMTHVLAFALAYPEMCDFAAGGGRTPRRARFGDLLFRGAFTPEVPIDAFLDDVRAYKLGAVTRLRPSFREGRHVLVLGIGRSGTRWVLRIVSEVLATAGVAHDASVPAIRGDGGASLAEHLRTSPPLYVEEDEGHLFDRVRGDPARLVQLACPPREVLATKIDREALASIDPRVLPRTSLVFVSRDPRDVALSQRAYFGDDPALALDDRVASVVSQHEAHATLAAARGAVSVRYEHLLRAPTESIDALARALGYPLERRDIASIAARTAFATMANGRAYGERRDGEYFRGGSSFAAEATAREASAIRERLGDRLRALGYEP